MRPGLRTSSLNDGRGRAALEESLWLASLAGPVGVTTMIRSLSHSQIFSIFQITPYVRYQDHTIDHNNVPITCMITFTNPHS